MQRREGIGNEGQDAIEAHLMESSKMMSVMVLRDIVVLPGSMAHFDLVNDIGVKVVETAMRQNKEMLVVSLVNSNIDGKTADDLHNVGCVCVIKQIIKIQKNMHRVLVNGVSRGILRRITSTSPVYEGEVTSVDYTDAGLDHVEKEGMLRNLRETLEIYFAENNRNNTDILRQMLNTDKLVRLVEQAAANIPMTMGEKQNFLNKLDFAEGYGELLFTINNEINISRIKKDLQAKVKERVDKNQREYILREQIKVIKEELGETNLLSDAEGYLETLASLNASEQVKTKIRKEIDRLRNISTSGAESAVARGYIETLLELPWDNRSVDNNDILNAERVLDEDHYGLRKVKDRVLEFLAVRTLTSKGDAPIICLVGPPGTGKTSVAKSVARALDKEYVRICLGGVRDEAEIRGHRRTYVGALPGRVITGLKGAKVKNPLMLLDEIDKVSSDYKGDTSSALLEVLDSEQNERFVDHYVEIPVDLSEVLFIATANTTQSIPKPLLDRMEIIEVNSYTSNEKYHIAMEHLMDKQMKKHGFARNQVTISGKAVERIIASYTREAGVRSLERRIGEILRKAAREILTSEPSTVGKIRITDRNLTRYLGKAKYKRDKGTRNAEVGIVRGLAWTSVGGAILEIEVNIVKGKGSVELTGQMGDVMKESAKAAISYVRSISEKYKVDDVFFEEHDIHIHIPEGAVPKDGPSAGITMATAIFSAVTGKPAKTEVAMTGEITLRGRVLPIGGLKEKILAAKTAGVRMVLVPKENMPDIEDLEAEIRENIDVRYVSSMGEVLKLSLS